MTTPREQALDIITRYYAAFNKGDYAAIQDLVSDDIAHDVNQGGRRTGKAAFKEFSAHMDKCYAEQLTDMMLMASDCGKLAAAEFVVNGTYKETDSGLPAATGQKYILPAGAFLEIKGGKIARVTTYYNLQDWINQVSKAA